MTKGSKVLIALGALWALKYAESTGYRKGKLAAYKDDLKLVGVRMAKKDEETEETFEVEEETPEEVKEE